MRPRNDTSTMKTAKKKPYRVVILPDRPGKLDRAEVRRVWREILNERMSTLKEQRKLARAA